VKSDRQTDVSVPDAAVMAVGDLSDRIRRLSAAEKIELRRQLGWEPVTIGRPVLADDPLLAEMRRQVDVGLSPWAAACAVAPQAEGNSKEAAAKRLHRKFKTRHRRPSAVKKFHKS
jgi:hypothetical protein